MKKPVAIIISLGALAVLLFVLLVIQSNCVGNYYMTKIDPVYIIPNESSMCRFEVNQMNNGSGDWWIYAQDDSNYYFFLGYDSLPYIVFSRSTAEKCIGFDKVNVDTWCGIDTNEIVFQVKYRNIKAKDSTVVYAERLNGRDTICCDDNSCKCAMCRLHRNDYKRYCETDSDSCETVIFKIKFRDMKARYSCEGPPEERVCDDTVVFIFPLDSSVVIKTPMPKNTEGSWNCKH